jgi:hypothetical protein
METMWLTQGLSRVGIESARCKNYSTLYDHHLMLQDEHISVLLDARGVGQRLDSNHLSELK